MKIVMMTNTYTPIVGGVERSIKAFTQEFQRLGHEVLIVTLEFDGMPENERGIFAFQPFVILMEVIFQYACLFQVT